MGSPMRVFNRSLMSTVSNRIFPAAATAAWLMLPQSCDWFRRRAISPNFVFNRAPMSTVPDRISSPVAAAAPWLMLPPTYEYGGNIFNRLFKVNGKMNYNFYSPTDDKVISTENKRSSTGEEKLNLRSEKQAVLVGSSHGWLALYKARYNLDMFLYNPLSHRHIKLPSVETIPLDQEENLRNRRPIKVVLSCSPDDDSNSCRAIMSFGPRSNMALCWPGQSTEWTPFGAQFHENDEITKKFIKFEDALVIRSYEDFVYSATLKQLFCVTQFADFESWDLGDDPNSSPRLNWKKAECDLNYDETTYPLYYEDDLCVVYKYLVFAEHSNQLFLVRRLVCHNMARDGSCVKPIYMVENFIPYKTVAFDVHEIDREKGELRYMNRTLNGMSFFIGSTGHGLVVESPETMNLKPNSIYFTDPEEKTPSDWYRFITYGGHDIGIFDYRNGTISPCYYPCDIKKVKRIRPAPMWFTPSLSPSPSPV